jgi:hypothetical protein
MSALQRRARCPCGLVYLANVFRNGLTYDGVLRLPVVLGCISRMEVCFCWLVEGGGDVECHPSHHNIDSAFCVRVLCWAIQDVQQIFCWCRMVSSASVWYFSMTARA